MDQGSQLAHTTLDRAEGPDVQVTTTITAGAGDGPPAQKIVVAVHGVGDQYSFATIQSVVNQFCAFYNHPAGIPLGNFHNGQRTFRFRSPYPEEPFGRFAFAEVYWAKIPRTLVDDKYTLEESKKWAHTIVERLKLRRKSDEPGQVGLQDGDFRLVKQVLSEMIQTIAVLDRVCWLAERAGLFSFDLRKLLEDYLGDVQIVAEFEQDRTKILQAFRDVLEEAHQTCPDASIYIVAHSEGTVVSLLGLLSAFREPIRPEWANHVRGLMTLGSPLDKHLALWPELFGEAGHAAPRHLPDRQIEWRNYYDCNDPIGFELDAVRDWIGLNGWEGVFNFQEDHDYGFTRYPFPGKAHVDYWTDEAVFGHFLTSVLEERRTAPAGSAVDFSQPPQDRHTAKWLSYVLPYVGIGALLCVGVYILFKAVTAAITPEGVASPRALEILATVLRTGLVLFGVTAAARVPRLTRNVSLRALSIAAAVIACAVYYLTASDGFESVMGVEVRNGAPTVVLALAVTLLAYTGSALRPSWGVTPLMLAAGLVVLGKVGYHLAAARLASDIGPVWPVFVATAAFLYLWWLAALMFDLVVVWHWYIGRSHIVSRMHDIVGRPGQGRTEGGAAPAAREMAGV